MLIQFTYYNKIKSHSKRQFLLLYTSMIFKLTFNNQTHLYNKSVSLDSLINFTKKVFRGIPDSFTFIYQSPKGQMTYIESDQDLIGLKYCCNSTNDFIIKLLIMKTERQDQFQYDQDIQTLNIVKQNLKQIEDDIFTDLQQQSKQEAVKQYLTQAYQKISKNIIQQQERILSSQVRIYLSNLYQVSAKSSSSFIPNSFVVQKQKTRKSVRFSPEKPVIYEALKSKDSEVNIDEIVIKRVMQIIPSIVQKYMEKWNKDQNKSVKNAQANNYKFKAQSIAKLAKEFLMDFQCYLKIQKSNETIRIDTYSFIRIIFYMFLFANQILFLYLIYKSLYYFHISFFRLNNFNQKLLNFYT